LTYEPIHKSTGRPGGGGLGIFPGGLMPRTADRSSGNP